MIIELLSLSASLGKKQELDGYSTKEMGRRLR